MKDLSPLFPQRVGSNILWLIIYLIKKKKNPSNPELKLLLLEIECAKKERVGDWHVTVTFQDTMSFAPTQTNGKIPCDVSDAQIGWFVALPRGRFPLQS